MLFSPYIKLLFLLFASNSIFSQTIISGKVQDESGKPLAAASVFLASTSFGTVANEAGQFRLMGMTPGRYDLVVSCMGYQTFSKSIDTRNATEPLTIVLKPKADELDNVTIGPGEETSWAKWGRFFIENFIGTMPEAQQCLIENPSVIRFRLNRKQQTLRATASKPLIITNKALGYTITYQLEYFQYDLGSKIVYFLGYPLFKEMEPKNNHRLKKWEENRLDAYYGSQMHFLRSIYRNTQLEEGFEMRKLVKQPNLEKERVKKLLNLNVVSTGPVQIMINGNSSKAPAASNPDSAEYYSQVLRQPDETDLLFSPILPGDSVAFQVNAFTAGFEFSDYLHITYVKEKEHPDYLRAQMRDPNTPGNQVSILKMNEPKTLEIDQQGQVNDPLLMLMTGYWAWSDKIATMLPYNYRPPD